MLSFQKDLRDDRPRLHLAISTHHHRVVHSPVALLLQTHDLILATAGESLTLKRPAAPNVIRSQRLT